MVETAQQSLARAQQALQERGWEEARAAFRRALEEQETAEAWEGLGLAAWWLDDVDGALEARERAYLLYRDRGDAQSAGRMAVFLALDYMLFRGEPAVFSGWVQRAHRLLDDLGPVPERAWLALNEAQFAILGEHDPQAAMEQARQAKAIARELGSLDLEMLSLAVEGDSLVAAGRVAEGMRQLDEATAAAVAGEMDDLYTVALTCCYMIYACERVRDFDRAAQWCEHVRRYCSRYGIDDLLGVCRAHYAAVLTSRGRWGEAEEQLQLSLQLLATRMAQAVEAVTRMGELRRRQGRLEEAKELFEQAGHHPLGQLGLARVALDRGDMETALDRCRQLLRQLPAENRIDRLEPLAVLVRILSAMGRADEADEAQRELEMVVGVIGTPVVQAQASRGRGWVALARGEPEHARVQLEDALHGFERGELPFEAASTRQGLARAMSQLGRAEAAQAHLERARETFQELGAAGMVEHSQAVGQELAVAAGQPGQDVLTPRQVEVLRLVARGLSNQEIAAELTLSEHTVRRHVANIMDRLDVPSRAAAVAHALERDLI